MQQMKSVENKTHRKGILDRRAVFYYDMNGMYLQETRESSQQSFPDIDINTEGE